MRASLQLAFAIAIASSPLSALAQDAPAGGDSTAPPAGGTTTTTTSTNVNYGAFGLPAPGTDLESHLGASSHAVTDTTNSTDGFDFSNSKGPASFTGGKGSQFVGEGSGAPDAHTVRRGDTLWGISAEYFKTPYNWPRIWAENPQIQNPHWIYPGDRVRLHEGQSFKIHRSGNHAVPSSTVFIRNFGWVDDPDKDTWGELVGSPSDKMMLSPEDEVYVQLDDDVKVELGDELSIFRVVHTMRGVEADAPGELVSVRGTLKINKINPKTHIARAKILEATDTIDRGARIGPVARKFEVVPPATNEKFVEARILTALYPHAFFGQNQVLFLDRGAKDGVKPGNRFLAVQRGDRWVDNLQDAGDLAARRALTEDDKLGGFDKVKTDGPEDLYPDELYAEIRVIDVREHTCMALVTESAYEVERDAVLVMKKGY